MLHFLLALHNVTKQASLGNTSISPSASLSKSSRRHASRTQVTPCLRPRACTVVMRPEHVQSCRRRFPLLKPAFPCTQCREKSCVQCTVQERKRVRQGEERDRRNGRWLICGTHQSHPRKCGPTAQQSIWDNKENRSPPPPRPQFKQALQSIWVGKYYIWTASNMIFIGICIVYFRTTTTRPMDGCMLESEHYCLSLLTCEDQNRPSSTRCATQMYMLLKQRKPRSI